MFVSLPSVISRVDALLPHGVRRHLTAELLSLLVYIVSVNKNCMAQRGQLADAFC